MGCHTAVNDNVSYVFKCLDLFHGQQEFLNFETAKKCQNKKNEICDNIKMETLSDKFLNQFGNDDPKPN